MHKLIVTSQHAGYRVITREATRNTHAWRRYAVENAGRLIFMDGLPTDVAVTMLLCIKQCRCGYSCGVN